MPVAAALPDPSQLGAADSQDAGGDAGSNHPTWPAARERGQLFAAASTAETGDEVARSIRRPCRCVLGAVSNADELLERTLRQRHVRTAKRDPQNNSKLDCQLRAGLGHRGAK